MTRILWPLLLLCVAIAAGLAQIDRQARYSSELSAWVPTYFASFSQVDSVRQAIVQERQQDALRGARRLVASRPIPAEHLRLLAEAQLDNGDKNLSAATIQRAARHGWRDPGVQQAMLVLAIEAGDDRQAAMRLAALWALSGDRELLRRYSSSVLNRPDARQHFAQILADARWKRNFLVQGPVVLPPEEFEATLAEALNAGAEFDCERLGKARQDVAASGGQPTNARLIQPDC